MTRVHNRNEKKRKNFHFETLELTWTFVVSISRLNTSSIIYSQYFQYDAILHINYIHLNSSTGNLHFDLWLPFNRGLIRTRLIDFPYETPLFINLIYQPYSTLTLFLFGQLIDSTNKPISLPKTKSTAHLSFYTFIPFQSISWSYDASSSTGRFLNILFACLYIYCCISIINYRLLCIFAW